MRWIAVVGCLAWGCGGPSPGDAGVDEAGAIDAGARDAGDEGAMDAGAGDAGAADAGPDLDGPTLTVDFPMADALLERDAVLIAGRARDATGVASVRVAGVEATSSDGFATWRATVSLSPGDNAIPIEAEDTLGHVTRAERRVLVRTPLGRVRQLAHDRGANALIVLAVRGEQPLLQRVDLATGLAEDAVDLSSLVGSGGAQPLGLALDVATQRAFLTVAQPGPTADVGVWVVDLASGAIGPFSTATVPDTSAPVLEMPGSVVLDASGGRLIVADRNARAILAVDLTTGTRSVISDTADPGPAILDYSLTLALDPAGGRLLASAHRIRSLPGLYAIDLSTGARSALSTNADGAPPLLAEPNGTIRLDASGPAYVLDRFNGFFEVDLATGVRRLLVPRSDGFHSYGFNLIPLDGAMAFGDSSAGRVTRVDASGAVSPVAQNALPRDLEAWPFRLSAPVDDALWLMGDRTLLRLQAGAVTERVGPADLDPARSVRAFAVHGPSGAAYATLDVGGVEPALERIDLATGARSIVRDATTSGPSIGDARGLAIDADGGRAFVLDEAYTLFAVSTTTGVAEPVGAPAVAGGQLLTWSAGRVLVASSNDRVVAVDPGDGSVTVISDAPAGGPAISDPDGMGVTSDGTIWVSDRERVIAISPDGTRRLVADSSTVDALSLRDELVGLSVSGARILVQDGQTRVLQLDPVTGDVVVIAERPGGS